MRSTTFLFVLLLAAPVMAVDTLQVHLADPVLASQRWTEFDRNSGLMGGVYDILEDRDGNMWFATDTGVQRYDGYRWTTYTTEDGLGANDVSTLIQTQNGARWFGTSSGGISRFDPSASSGQAAWTTYTTDQGLPQYIRADEGKVRQVLINLLGNAIKFTEVGKVVLRVSSSEDELETRLFFEVEDTGPGIASGEVSMLFEAFVQTNIGQQASEGTRRVRSSRGRRRSARARRVDPMETPSDLDGYADARDGWL